MLSSYRFFIGYWINTGVEFLFMPLFILTLTCKLICMKWSVLISTTILSAIFILSKGTSSNLTPVNLATRVGSSPINYRIDLTEPSFNQQVKEAIYRLFSSAFKRASLRIKADDILDEVEQLGNASDILALTPDTLTGENKNLGQRLHDILTTIQLTDLPVLRKNYISWLKHSLTKQNIVIESSGQTIVLEGVVFAKREQIESFNKLFMKALQKLRFRKIVYKWINTDEDPACFEVSDANDRDISFNAYH
jgi:hypothetical protein